MSADELASYAAPQDGAGAPDVGRSLTSERGPVGAPDESCDVLVIGSGAGGLAAAVTSAYHGLAVTVVEKARHCGGATAWSGGWMFTPGSPFAVADGVTDGTDGARTYLRNRCGADFDAERVEAFLASAPDMVAFFENRTFLRFTPGTWICDIHGATEGAGTGNRSVGPAPVSKRALSPQVRRILARQLYETSFLGMGIMAGPDLGNFLKASQRDPAGLLHATKRVSRHLLDLAVFREGQHLVNGTALIGRLLQSAVDLGVTVHVATPATALVRDESGAVRGAIVKGATGERYVAARRGVVLAAGGYPQDRLRRIRTFPHGLGGEHHSLAPSGADGDGIRLGEWAGGHVDLGVASAVAWCPVSLVPYRSGRVGVFPHILDRGKPGVIGVLRDGRRFVNEADGYHDYVLGMVGSVPEGEPVESWLVCDHEYIRKYPLGMAKPFPVPLQPYERSGYVVSAPTLRELAGRCGIDPEGLEQTVARFNEGARRGEDPDFARGRSPFNRGSGDPLVGPNPSLAPIEHGPFHAVKVLPGSFGTFAGLACDVDARVLGGDGMPVPGLFAVGTDQASVFGGHYPSGGINIGPAMVFGYRAARSLAGAVGPELPFERAVAAAGARERG